MRHLVVVTIHKDWHNLLITCPSAMITSMWYWFPDDFTMSIAARMAGANDVGPLKQEVIQVISSI